MLVPSRHVAESIVVGDDVIITVVRIAGDEVRPGFTAPPGVKILRAELIHRRAAGAAGRDCLEHHD